MPRIPQDASDKAHWTAAPLPRLMSVKRTCDEGGFGRGTYYKLVGLGLIRAVKSGARTMTVTESFPEYLGSLPAAEIKPGSGTKGAPNVRRGKPRTSPEAPGPEAA